MVSISEVTILSVDKSEDSWAIEGEILFESDLTTGFEATYLPDEDDEIEDLALEINPGKYDKALLKEQIISAVMDFDE